MQSAFQLRQANRGYYVICQLSGWLLLYALISTGVWMRPVFNPVELLYAGVLVGSSAVGSHMIRAGYKKHFRNKAIWQQVCFLLISSTLIAAIATLLLVVSVFSLAQFGVTDPIPAPQRWFVTKVVFTGNYFNMLLALLFWSALYFSVLKVRQLRQTNELLKSSQLDALINQLNPHFLFNAINNIRALILEDPVRARDMLARLADMLRYSLSKDDHVKVPLSAEVAIVNEYIALCSIQFEERLRFAINADANCQQALLPKLLLQLCVENAVKHGISKQVNGGSIQVQICQQDALLDIRIRNDGELTAPDNKAGLGLQNIRQRLALLYPDSQQTGVTLYREPNQVCTHIRLPLEF